MAFETLRDLGISPLRLLRRGRASGGRLGAALRRPQGNGDATPSAARVP